MKEQVEKSEQLSDFEKFESFEVENTKQIKGGSSKNFIGIEEADNN